MSPHCQNCEKFVTADYARVFAFEGEQDPRVCPFCEDKKRGMGAKPRDARANTRGAER